MSELFSRCPTLELPVTLLTGAGVRQKKCTLEFPTLLCCALCCYDSVMGC